MTARENLVEVLEGREPKTTPYTIYHEYLKGAYNQDTWQRLFDRGLSVCWHCEAVKAIEQGVKNVIEEKTVAGTVYSIHRKQTPVGTIQKVTANGWHQEGWVKKPDDYKVIQWIVENTELIANYDEVIEAEQRIGDHGVAMLMGPGRWLARSPAMSVNIDWAGTQQFCLDIAMEVDELMELIQLKNKQFVEMNQLLAAGPGRYVKWPENLTISMLGPQRYKELLVAPYLECVPILEAGGKRVAVHYDGALSVIADQIADAPFHIIDSLTEAPEGDMTYDQCRVAWPDKVFWANINVACYQLPEEQLRETILAKRQRAGKKAFAFEISEQLQENFQTTIPIVLDTLRHAR